MNVLGLKKNDIHNELILILHKLFFFSRKTFQGLGFRPIPRMPESRSLIWYNATNATQIDDWVSNIDGFLDRKFTHKNLSIKMKPYEMITIGNPEFFDKITHKPQQLPFLLNFHNVRKFRNGKFSAKKKFCTHPVSSFDVRLQGFSEITEWRSKSTGVQLRSPNRWAWKCLCSWGRAIRSLLAREKIRFP